MNKFYIKYLIKGHNTSYTPITSDPTLIPYDCDPSLTKDEVSALALKQLKETLVDGLIYYDFKAMAKKPHTVFIKPEALIGGEIHFIEP